MSNWPIRLQITVLISLPALFVWGALTASSIYTSWSVLTESQQRHGQILARQIAPSAEFAIFSGNMKPLQSLLEQNIADSDITMVEVYDMEFHLLNRTGSRAHQTPTSNTPQPRTFTAPVYSSAVQLDNSSPNPPAEQIGAVTITLSSQPILEAQEKIVRQSLWLGALSLLLITVLILILTNRMATLFKTLRCAIRQIATGDFSPPKQALPSHGELGELSQDIYKMSAALERNRKATLAAYKQLETRALEAERFATDQSSSSL